MGDRILWQTVGNGIIHGFTLEDLKAETDIPRIEVDCSDGAVWRFTLDNRKGSGAVMVGPGCFYNPLSLIQSMWVGFENGQFAGLQPNARIQFNDNISQEEWSGMFGEDMA